MLFDILLTSAAALLSVACSEPSFEEKAKSHLREMAETVANDPKNLVIQNEHVVFSNDSVCIIAYTAKDKNKRGKDVLKSYEYYFVYCDATLDFAPKKLYYGVYDVDNCEELTAKYQVDDFIDCVKSDTTDIEELTAFGYYMVANGMASFDKREVPE